jgi:hypothetical protein
VDVGTETTLPVRSVAAGQYDHLTEEEWNDLLEAVRTQDRAARRIRRAAHTRGFIISLVLILQGLSDVHMWSRV